MKWISMSEREPKPGYWYLTVLKTCNVYNISYWSGNHWRNSYGDKHETHEVAYWCSLPPKPNKLEMAVEKLEFALSHHFEMRMYGYVKDALLLLKEHLKDTQHEMP